MAEETVEISLVNDLREVAGVAARIDEFCAHRNLTPQVAFAVNLSLDEILTNTISYGYDDDDPHRIEVVVRLEDERLVVVIMDDGRAFDLSQAQEVDIGASLEDRAVGGLGLFLVHQMMDRVEYRRIDGCNIVTLTKGTTDNSPDTSG